MSCNITSVFTFKIESTFEEWVAIFDSAEADKRHSEYNIQPLYRGVSKEDPQKVIVIHQAPKVIFKSLLKLMVTGWQPIELTFQLWKNHFGFND